MADQPIKTTFKWEMWMFIPLLAVLGFLYYTGWFDQAKLWIAQNQTITLIAGIAILALLFWLFRRPPESTYVDPKKVYHMFQSGTSRGRTYPSAQILPWSESKFVGLYNNVYVYRIRPEAYFNNQDIRLLALNATMHSANDDSTNFVFELDGDRSDHEIFNYLDRVFKKETLEGITSELLREQAKSKLNEFKEAE